MKSTRPVGLFRRIDRVDAEDVLVVVVVVLDLVLDRRRGRADAEEDGLGANDVRQLAERDAAVVAAEQHVDVILAGQLVDGGDAHLRPVGRGLALIGDDHLELAPHDAALGVDLVDGELGRVDGVAPDLELDRRVDADDDRLLLGAGRRGKAKRRGAGERQRQIRFSFHARLPERSFLDQLRSSRALLTSGRFYCGLLSPCGRGCDRKAIAGEGAGDDELGGLKRHVAGLPLTLPLRGSLPLPQGERVDARWITRRRWRRARGCGRRRAARLRAPSPS